MEEELLVLERSPPRFDHGVRELQFRQRQDAAQDSRCDQLVDLAIDVLDTAIPQRTGMQPITLNGGERLGGLVHEYERAA